MADVGEQEAVGEKEATKPPSPKPDTQDVSPPLISMKSRFEIIQIYFLMPRSTCSSTTSSSLHNNKVTTMLL